MFRVYSVPSAQQVRAFSSESREVTEDSYGEGAHGHSRKNFMLKERKIVELKNILIFFLILAFIECLCIHLVLIT